MQRITCLTVFLLFLVPQSARPDIPLYPSFDAFEAALVGLGDIADPAARDAAVDTFWSPLVAAGQVPYTQGDDAALLHRGPGSIAFAGDFNGWNPSNGAATRVPGTDLWYLTRSAPADARIDYKIVRNGTWILDPVNPLQQWSGFGPNSELRMPEYVFPEETLRDPSAPRGSLTGNVRLSSAEIAGDVNVRVYTPAGYQVGDALPTVYITDGHEYLDDRLGAAVTVLDNTIASGELQPTVAVFIDPRDPRTGTNRRASQLGGAGKADFADFIAHELVPYIDTTYGTAADPERRAILGTSLGGLFSAFMGARHPDVIANLAIQSPAFWFDPNIYDAYAGNTTLVEALQIYMHTGTINDDGGGSQMASLLASGGYDFAFEWVNQGHSWGHWKGQIDDALVELIGPVPEPAAGLVLLTLFATVRGRPCRRRASASTPRANRPNPRD